jgi:peptidoglycan/LPS O-acetylase OafA/YrhL
MVDRLGEFDEITAACARYTTTQLMMTKQGSLTSALTNINPREREESLWAVLAALRFFLAMIVVVGHCCSFLGGPSDWSYIGLWLNQGSAVFGFFIISGYSIAASIEQGQVGFYRRRILRIWPQYLVCIFFGLLVSLCIPHGLTWPTGVRLPPTSGASVAASLLMLQTIVGPSIPVIGQIWSLSPEWWHYMAAPALRRFSTLALLALLGGSFAAFMLIPTPPGGGPEKFTHGLALLTLSWLWVTGFIYRRLDRQPIGIAVLLIPSVYAHFFGYPTGAPLFIAIFVLFLSGEFRLSKQCRRICLFLGDISFPLYLFHVPTMVLLFSFGVNGSALMVVGSLLVSIVALYGVDYPSRRRFRVDPKRLKKAIPALVPRA